MNTLARHIEALLVKHNCVVVPKLGGFIAHFTPAYYNEREETFVPPCRKVSFNSMLSINDGLLIERYIYQEEMTYTEATRYLSRQVSMLKDYIEENGAFELIGVGVLSTNGEGGFCFTPREGGLLTPCTYGLENTGISPLSKINNVKADEMPSENVKETSNTYTIRFSKTIVNYLAAAVMAVMFYFLVVPNGVFPSENMNQATMWPTKIEHRVIHHHHVTIVKKHKPQTIVSNKTLPAVVTASENKNEYVIVLASAIAEKYAQLYIDHLEKRYNLNARIIQKNGMRRVVTGHYNTEGEARASLRLLTDRDCFADCWIMQSPA